MGAGSIPKTFDKCCNFQKHLYDESAPSCSHGGRKAPKIWWRIADQGDKQTTFIAIKSMHAKNLESRTALDSKQFPTVGKPMTTS